MLSREEIERLQAALRNIDGLLKGIVDFREYPQLLISEDETLQNFLERTVRNVQDARKLSAEVLVQLEEAQQVDTEEEKLAAEATLAAAKPPPAPVPETTRTFSPPANMEQIFMANPTGMREVVLLADHDPTSLAAAEEMLTDEDYRVIGVRDAFEAVSIYGRLWTAIDLVVLDFSMPGLSGDLIFDEMQTINPNVAAVISGGYTHPDKLREMLARGLSGFLPKPYNREKLIRQIQQVLAHRPPSTGAKRF